MKTRITNPDIDLGLAISACSLHYGQTRSLSELAAYCGCSKSAIQQIEERAMRKLRHGLQLADLRLQVYQ